jgi:uncharacterized protein (TIGR03435 family)
MFVRMLPIAIWGAKRDESGGDVAAAPDASKALPLFVAVQPQLGLRFDAERGPVSVLVIDRAVQPTTN